MSPGPTADLLTVLRVACFEQPPLPLTALGERGVRWAVETGVGPLLARVAVPDPAATTSRLGSLLRGATLTARCLTAQHLGAMTEILDAFSDEIPPPVLLKGISFCDEHYPEAHLRPMRDIDFLLEGHTIPAAESLLRKLGYRQSSVRPTSFYEGHHHSAPFVHVDTGVWVDVHRALVTPREQLVSCGIFDVEHVMTQLRASQFQGRRVRRLSPELEIVHLACHWARGLRVVGGMVAMADMAFLLKNTPQVDWDRILHWVAPSPAARALCVLLTYLDKHHVIVIASDVLQRLGQTRRSPGPLTLRLAHSLLDRYVVEGRDFGWLVSERTFNRLWKLLILGRGSSRRGAVQPSRPPRTPLAALNGPGAVRGPNGWTVNGDGELRRSELAGPGKEKSMKGHGADAGVGFSPLPGTADDRAVGASAGGHPKRRSGLRARAVDGEIVILDRHRHLVHQVNQTARFIWERCDGRHTVAHIARELARDFDVDVVAAERDVAAAVRQLEAAGLVDTQTEWAPAEPQARRDS
jgi:hypothetical protein